MNSRVWVLLGAIVLLAVVAVSFLIIGVEEVPTDRTISIGTDIQPTPKLSGEIVIIWSPDKVCFPEVEVGAFVYQGIGIRMTEQEYAEHCE